MEPRISILTLGVSDLERSVKFYRDGLKLPTNYKAGEGIASASIIEPRQRKNIFTLHVSMYNPKRPRSRHL
jgi:catechol 2,3-dioxygenase-like lactoylglutathione lyase family enzyme